VLLAFLPGNDLNDNYRPLTLESQMRPYFQLDDQNQLVLDDRFLTDHEYVMRQSWYSRVKYFVVDHSRLAQLINTYRLGSTSNETAAENPATALPKQLDIGLGEQAYKTPRGEWVEAWSITQCLIQQLQQEVLQSGAKFGIVVLTTGLQTHPDPIVQKSFAAELGMPDLLEPDRILQEFCQGSTPPIPMLSLAPDLQKIASEKQIAMHGFAANLNRGHWNANGHRYAGELIAAWLQNQPELLGKPAAKSE
jgi:hypothetical protein